MGMLKVALWFNKFWFYSHELGLPAPTPPPKKKVVTLSSCWAFLFAKVVLDRIAASINQEVGV